MKNALRIIALSLAVGACIQVVRSYASGNKDLTTIKDIIASPIREGGAGEPGI